MDRVLTVPIRKFDLEVTAANALEDQDFLAVEEPLQIRIGSWDLAVTMRTPGNDEELAAGFLFTEGFIQKTSDIADIRCGRNTAVVTLSPEVQIDSSLQRNFYVTSSCGVCGKASIELLEKAGCIRLPSRPRVTETVIRSIPEKLGESQAIFKRTGGLHASALFSSEGELVSVREDVGRHNALDKLIGMALLDGRLPLHEYILAVSGRTSFELLQKAVMAGIPVLAAVGAQIGRAHV